ncbi:MAG: pyridoxamine 5'-phosphate oxidase family protein, partial [Candidatus Binatia bacterium]
IRENPNVAVVADDYSDDWSRLAYLLIQGRADVVEKGETHERALRLLRAKYPQYREMPLEERPVIRITPERIVSWSGALDRETRQR